MTLIGIDFLGPFPIILYLNSTQLLLTLINNTNNGFFGMIMKGSGIRVLC